MDELGAVRIGDCERQAAVEALTAHREAGRIDPTEFEERQVAASRARTWVEIVPLFADLPEPRPVGMPAGLAGIPTPVPYTPVSASTEPGRPPTVFEGLVPVRYRDTIMALTPFAAVALFFVTKSWMWFLAIPVTAILLYGPDGDKGRKGGCDRRRGR
jgi:hypothetical protein